MAADAGGDRHAAISGVQVGAVGGFGAGRIENCQVSVFLAYASSNFSFRPEYYYDPNGWRTSTGVLTVTAQAEGGAIAGSVVLSGDRRAVEIEVDKLNQSGILPPGVRLEKVQTRSVKRSSQPERAADSPGR